MQIQKSISKRSKKALIGQEFDLLLEGTSEETDLLLEGRTAMHAPEIDGKVFVNDVPEDMTRIPASSIAARSPNPTTTIWWPRFCRKPWLETGSKTKVPHLQESRCTQKTQNFLFAASGAV